MASQQQPLLSDKPAKSSFKQPPKPQAGKRKVDFSAAKKTRKKAKKRTAKVIAFVQRILKSDPSEHRGVKMVLGFPIGLIIAGALYLTVIQPLDLDPDVRNLAGSLMAVALGLGYAFSVQVRCIVLLVLPIFFGKAGRSFVGAFALIFLLSGPIDNIVTNCREVARSLTCLAQLLANHTIAKWKLRLNPLKEAVEELQEEGFMIGRVSQAVRSAFGPIVREMEDTNEVEEMEEDLEEVEKIIEESKEKGPPPNAFSVQQVEDKHKLTGKLSQAQAVQENWEKKLDLRCEDVFGKAVIKCREWFGDLWDKCLNALWILGYVLCLPLKMTFFCELVKIIPGALGMNCESMDVVEPGLGDTYQAAKDMISEVAEGLKVQLQYRLTSMGDSGPSVMTAEEIRARAMHEFDSKARWANLLLMVVKGLVACTFLLVFRASYQYNKGYLTKFQYDNVYITRYFRRIDARRHAQGKKTLLPLKKSEKKTVIFPTSLKMMPREKKLVTSSIGGLIFRVIMTGLVVYVDSLLVWIMDVIYRNSKIEYHQTGEHFVNITVRGSGFMAEIVRMFMSTLNSHHKLDSVTTNHACLPLPSVLKNVLVFAVHFAVFIFILLEAYGLRLRRLICSFFYRKREKRRVLYLYNEMLKKRKGYLRHMRHRVRKQIRNRKLKGQTNVLTALKLQFPRLCCCLRWLKSSRDSCLICQEPEGKGFQRCPTPGCNWGYCAECWKDIKRRCYACGGRPDGESGTDPSEDDEDESSDTSGIDDDQRFLH
ncbi:E3 ubiquitin-protein ligase DCST1-like [Babylonia areolata]|uniref:E3 ubiquitin-protein ligase DCST1-like n=1 Tax=Babylonia areolata TaxID=304850 RepID=UPI003FCFC144